MIFNRLLEENSNTDPMNGVPHDKVPLFAVKSFLQENHTTKNSSSNLYLYNATDFKCNQNLNINYKYNQNLNNEIPLELSYPQFCSLVEDLQVKEQLIDGYKEIALNNDIGDIGDSAEGPRLNLNLVKAESEVDVDAEVDPSLKYDNVFRIKPNTPTEFKRKSSTVPNPLHYDSEYSESDERISLDNSIQNDNEDNKENEDSNEDENEKNSDSNYSNNNIPYLNQNNLISDEYCLLEKSNVSDVSKNKYNTKYKNILNSSENKNIHNKDQQPEYVYSVQINETRQVAGTMMSRSYTEYKIQTYSTKANDVHSSSNSNSKLNSKLNYGFSYHRFQHFEELFEFLQANYLGIIVSALPDKAILQKNNADVIRYRQKFLAEWLNGILRHRVLSQDAFLHVFLKNDGTSQEFQRYLDKPSLKNTLLKGSHKLYTNFVDTYSSYMDPNVNLFDTDGSTLFADNWHTAVQAHQLLMKTKNEVCKIIKYSKILSKHIVQYSIHVENYCNLENQFKFGSGSREKKNWDNPGKQNDDNPKKYVNNNSGVVDSFSKAIPPHLDSITKELDSIYCFSEFNSKMSQILDKYLYETKLISQSIIDKNIKNLEGTLQKLDQRKQKIKEIHRMEDQLNELEAKATKVREKSRSCESEKHQKCQQYNQQPSSLEFDQVRKLEEQVERSSADLADSQTVFSQELQANGRLRLEQLHSMFEEYSRSLHKVGTEFISEIKINDEKYDTNENYCNIESTQYDTKDSTEALIEDYRLVDN